MHRYSINIRYYVFKGPDWSPTHSRESVIPGVTRLKGAHWEVPSPDTSSPQNPLYCSHLRDKVAWVCPWFPSHHFIPCFILNTILYGKSLGVWKFLTCLVKQRLVGLHIPTGPDWNPQRCRVPVSGPRSGAPSGPSRGQRSTESHRNAPGFPLGTQQLNTVKCLSALPGAPTPPLIP